jgi:hypothetical protein
VAGLVTLDVETRALRDSERLDLSVLSLYCELVRQIQREVKVVWEGGQPVARTPTPVPGCVNRP